MPEGCRILRHDINVLPHEALTTHHPHGAPKFCEIKKNKDGNILSYHMSLLDELKNEEATGVKRTHRKDIILITLEYESVCSECGHTHACGQRQVAVFPGEYGTLYGNGFQHLTPEDKIWAVEESCKCWKVAQHEPLFYKMLYDYDV